MNPRLNIVLALATVALLVPAGGALAKMSIVDSPHNLSATGGGGKHNIFFTEETRICVFCHAPHNTKAATDMPLPLWNRNLPSEATPYTMYGSTTFNTAVNTKSDRPTGPSRLCLSCHDGSIALNSYGGASQTTTLVYMPTSPDPTSNPNLTSDLSNSHPISFPYTPDLAAKAELRNPGALPPQIKLEGGEMLQCTSCHDAHNNEFGNFLVIDNKPSGSPLCVTCHVPAGWDGSNHNPLQVSSMGPACMNCHYAHSAPGAVRLLHAKKEVENCITATCHSNGTTPPSAVMQPMFTQNYRHPVGIYAGVHDEAERLPVQQLHVECVDCHNPHQANRTGVPLSNPPAADGPLRGVTGINRDTLAPGVAQYEYEVCFKCHSGPNAGSFFGISNTPVKRIITEPDENKRFNRYQTTSFHPVTYQRLGTGASLWSSLQTSMLMIYCCDCHNSDQSSKAGGTGPNGPHGSQYEHIMIQRYDEPPLPPDVWSPVNDFVTRYGVCFRCHSDNFVMSTSSGFVNSGVSEHGTHVQDRGIPCFACHDPHGIPSNGITFTNSTHLVNFAQAWSVSVAVPVPSYNPDTRTCVVSCHTSANHSHTYTR